MVVAAGIVLILGAPLGLITTAVQALAGLLLPSASVFLLLLCNDRQVLGPWTNPRWLNLVAGLIIGVLLVLSGILLTTTLFPSANTLVITTVLAAALVAGSLAALLVLRLIRRRTGPVTPVAPPVHRSQRATWRMPPLATLRPVAWSPGLRLGMIVLRGYLILSALLLVVKAIQLSHG